ncbi:serine protease inhibitor A3L-like [Spea bombifrons]|uniref:serine protease inhibitor A3L-like n=1 Tax=Spea bombifrons TaxID=233779 RepID=UPI0023499B81|nr:serine protease inhibitor A3L-like [Spea bombifrons]XP_053331709.1 serine protease inhibitor A3L-like [Spea bombifrons]
MKYFLYLVLFIPVTFASDHDVDGNAEVAERIAKIRKELSQANIGFAVGLYKKIVLKDSESQHNHFFSPVSISSAFSMLSLGAKSATHKQITEGLHLNRTQLNERDIHEAFEHNIRSLNQPKDDLLVNIGNALFLDKNMSLLNSFEEDAQRYYNAEILTANFKNIEGVEKLINDYVQNKTKGKIKELVKDLDKRALMVVVNYILFKGEWINPFNPLFTQTHNFSVDEKTKVKVPMMSRIGLYKILLDPQLPCIVIELPYKGQASMLLVIPELGKIHEVEEALSPETISRWKNSTKQRIIDLRVPKFSIGSSIDLKEIISDMGMADVFSILADFSGITSDVKLVLSKAVHKAVLDVDEKGTEAAAATEIEAVFTALFPTHRVDRPFLLMICDQETDSILFMGRVINPVEK